MTYYPDLSTYSYRPYKDKALNVGWLSKSHPFASGDVSKEFIDRLAMFCQCRLYQTRGKHWCEWCFDTPRPDTGFFEVQHGNIKLFLGHAEIRVFGENDQIYAAPTLIYHYVVKHHYCPPDDFVTAVLTGPLPGTSAYEARAQTCNWYESYQKVAASLHNQRRGQFRTLVTDFISRLQRK